MFTWLSVWINRMTQRLPDWRGSCVLFFLCSEGWKCLSSLCPHGRWRTPEAFMWIRRTEISEGEIVEFKRRTDSAKNNESGDSKRNCNSSKVHTFWGMHAGWLIFTFTLASVLLSGPDRPGDSRRQSNFSTGCQRMSTSCFSFTLI